MKNTIETENGIITIIERYGKDFKIEMFDPSTDDSNILYAEYSSDFYRLEDKYQINNLFKELKPQIIEIMKFYVNDNPEFYKHFDIDPNYTLISDYANFTPKGDNKYFHINYPKFLKAELKSDSLEYLKSLTDEQKRFAYGY